MSSGKSGFGRFKKKIQRQVGREFYDTLITKESDNYTAFIKQLINIVIESAIDKYEKESCNLITLYRVS